MVTARNGVQTLVNPGKGYEDLHLPLGVLRISGQLPTRGSAWSRCATTAAPRWPSGIDVKPDTVAGVPDSGTAHAVGYANESGIPFSRPFIKYTPTWPRSFMPTIQSKRDLIAKMKLIPVQDLIKDKSLLADRRFHCPRNPAAGDHGVSVSRAGRRKSTSVRPARRCCTAASI